MTRDFGSSAKRILIWIAVAGLVGIYLSPIIWGALASFKTASEIVSYSESIFSFSPTLNNYRSVLDGDFYIGLRNSALYGFASVAIGLMVASLAAYGLDRFSFPGRSIALFVVVACIPMAIGSAALVIPNYLFFTGLGMTNTWLTLPLLYCVYSLPLAVWVIKGSLESIPTELDEAAYIDGASSFTIFSSIILPLSRPAIGAAGWLIFIYGWNEFVAGSVMVDSLSLKPVQPMLYAYIGFFGRQWELLTAAATLAVLPIFLIYCFFGRMLIAGLTRGAVKG